MTSSFSWTISFMDFVIGGTLHDMLVIGQRTQVICVWINVAMFDANCTGNISVRTKKQSVNVFYTNHFITVKRHIIVPAPTPTPITSQNTLRNVAIFVALLIRIESCSTSYLIDVVARFRLIENCMESVFACLFGRIKPDFCNIKIQLSGHWCSYTVWVINKIYFVICFLGML